MEWKDKMYLVLFQAPQKTKLLRFLFFVGYSFRLLVETCMSICFQLQVACLSHLVHSWSLYTCILSLSFTVQDIGFSLPLSLGSSDRSSVGNNGTYRWNIASCVQCEMFTFDFIPLLPFLPKKKKKKEEKNPTNILFPPSGAVWSSVLHRK